MSVGFAFALSLSDLDIIFVLLPTGFLVGKYLSVTLAKLHLLAGGEIMVSQITALFILKPPTASNW